MYERGDEMFSSQASKSQGSKSQGGEQQSRQAKKKGEGKGRSNGDGYQEAKQDTVIGKGFTAAMKRGVAQAKPTAKREELQQQKDGGFIATIQRGFEGLFGKPTSKEEVLRKRGAVLANEYEAVPGDEVDQYVEFFARRLPEDVAGCLKIFRAAKGEYQINDEKVNMEQKFRQGFNGQTESEIFVFWETEAGEKSDPEPLGDYLSHAANVAYEVKQGGNVITQVPDHARISFHDEIGTKLTDGSADARFNAMEVAARQARMREEAAMEWREKQNNPAKSTPPAEAPSAIMESPRAVKDRPPSTESAHEEPSFIDQALQAVGAMAAPRTAPVYAAPAAAAPAGGFPGMSGMPRPNGSQPQAGTFMMQPQAGTFMMQQAAVGPTRQSTYMAYGTGAPAGVAGANGYPMPRQGTFLSASGYSASGYAYGSSYAVPVR
jgi:hypothetical protein